MKPKFVQTSNVLAFDQAMLQLARRGASEACLVVVDGVPGLGKTTSLSRFAAQHKAVYLRAKKEWRPTWFLNEMLEQMRQVPPHAFEKKYKMALGMLGHRQSTALATGRTFALIIDEADHISSNERIMETIRDLSDMLEMPVILVGMGKIRNNLVRFPQIASRISQYVSFNPASVADVRMFFDEKCEVQVADDLVRLVHRVTEGMNREIMEAMANIERFGLRNEASEGGLNVRDMAGQLLVNDRTTSQPIHVPTALTAVAAQ